MGSRKEGYRERLDKQTEDWASGTPIHNLIDDECCPDFSCCKPELLAPKEVRELFQKARETNNRKLEDRLLGEFLAKLLDNENIKKGHIAGLEASREEVD